MSDEQRKMVFDAVRAGFYLVAAVIGVHLFLSIAAALSCIYMGLRANDLVLSHPDLAGKFETLCGETRSQITEVLAAALAAALAYSGGRSIPRE